MNHTQAKELKQSIVNDFINNDKKVIRSINGSSNYNDYTNLKDDILEYVNGVSVVKNGEDGYAVKLYTEGNISLSSIMAYMGLSHKEILLDNIGPITIQGANSFRPGCSIGHYSVSGGTLGCFVKDKDDKRYALSNSHVLANFNKGRYNDSILHPGQKDGGTQPYDSIGFLTKHIVIKFNKEHNFVDCAIALLKDQHNANNHVEEMGTISTFIEPKEEMGVVKKGKTTNLTYGTITSTDSTIKVDYGGSFFFRNTAIFEGQIEIKGIGDRFSKLGDSGSLIVNNKLPAVSAVGLLFASGADGTTFANPISWVLKELDVALL